MEGMISMDQYDHLRAAHRVYGKSIWQIVRDTGHDPKTIRKVLRHEPADPRLAGCPSGARRLVVGLLGNGYLYGTWTTFLGWGAAGVRKDGSRAARRGCNWRPSVSTPSQTAWALEGLLAVARDPLEDPMVRRGIAFLLANYRPGSGWEEDYPKGAGFAGKP
jgi:hypothetical protein